MFIIASNSSNMEFTKFDDNEQKESVHVIKQALRLQLHIVSKCYIMWKKLSWKIIPWHKVIITAFPESGVKSKNKLELPIAHHTVHEAVVFFINDKMFQMNGQPNKSFKPAFLDIYTG